jgi:uroporphyrinogen decarboxylase
MNERERFISCMKFEKTDRVPDMELGVWPETLARWRSEGMPWWIENLWHFSDYFRMDKSFNCYWMHINDRLFPDQSFHVVESTPEWEIIESNIGMRMKRSFKNASIPQYFKFPVETMADYRKISNLLDPASPGRYFEDFDRDLAHRTMREELRGINFCGLFGFGREIMGLENYCMAIYDEPELVEAILDDRVKMAEILYRRATDAQGIDFVQMWEDMAYKSGPLVSPDFMEGKMLERYMKIVEIFKSGGVRLIMMDCDGNIEKMVPIIKKSGMDGIYPCEIAAGSDPVKLRRMFPGVALAGGVDKRALSGGGTDGVKAELRRLQPLVKEGGYIPYIDHFIPPDIPYETFCFYRSLKADLLNNPDMKI